MRGGEVARVEWLRVGDSVDRIPEVGSVFGGVADGHFVLSLVGYRVGEAIRCDDGGRGCRGLPGTPHSHDPNTLKRSQRSGQFS